MQTRSVARWGRRVMVVAGLLVTTLVVLASAAWAASITVDPTSGPGGSSITVTGSGFPGKCAIYVTFLDASGTGTTLGTLPHSTSFQVQETIPSNAAVGQGTVRA